MSILFPESVLSNRERFIRETLHQGHEYATKLKFLLQKPIASDSDDGSTFSSSSAAEELLSNVLRSFTDTISVLSNSSSCYSNACDNVLDVAGAVNEVGLNCGENGSHSQVGANSSCNDLRSEDSTESKKRSLTSSTTPTAAKDRRGSYKRRRTEQTWTHVSQTGDDNHAWRKYGQKEILNSKFPRGYFRCSRKHDQGCRAIKQVQRMQDNPDMYLTTYIGFHTCKDNLNKAPQMLTFSDTNWDSSFLMMNSNNNNNNNNNNSDSKVPNDEKEDPICSSSLTSIIKQEHPKEDTPSDDLTDKLDPALWSDYLKDLELSKPADNNNADTSVYSCTDSQSLDMDFGVFSSHFSTAGFHFDESHLL